VQKATGVTQVRMWRGGVPAQARGTDEKQGETTAAGIQKCARAFQRECVSAERATIAGLFFREPPRVFVRPPAGKFRRAQNVAFGLFEKFDFRDDFGPSPDALFPLPQWSGLQQEGSASTPTVASNHFWRVTR
jgi:hypothetical protein